ncbi:nuclease harbi1 [Lasius niger]|uniref:Nuclease harbi1 n=1 Tax=Lasius niger TaxID=67767 RepID=A0A0J7KB05_LASNI|nr:nuclease harbi1 [Lasius niger]
MEFIYLTSLSESEEESEDELEYIMHVMERKKKLPRLEDYVENIVPAYSGQQFKSHFRVHAGLPMISPAKQFLIATWRMATPDSYRSICEKFNVSRATALSATRRVIRALYDLAPTVIKWPSVNNVNEVWTGFEAISGFPKIIGAIDGMSYLSGHASMTAHCMLKVMQYVIIKHTSFIALQDIQGLCMTSEYSDYQNCKSG